MVLVQVGKKLLKDSSFDYFRQEGKIGDRSVIFQNILVERGFLQEGFHNGSFESGWKGTRQQRRVDNVGKGGKKIIKKLSEEGCRHWVKRTGRRF